ncbi:L,D-transpeptidase family protein [Stackebrandtia soli]|uniref:L,D-transpeptidase family protein n=1 Tax=Stackebrandtia soli TaxID=1892856 RepID=UPI0039E7B252
MRIRRSLAVSVAAVAAVLAASAGVYAYASAPDADTASPPPVEKTAEPEKTEPEPEADPDPGRVPTTKHKCGDTGEEQLEVERMLSIIGGYGEIFVDGDQSKEDCKAIKKFQKDMGIQPANGYAGDLTRSVAERIRDTDFLSCDPGDDLVVCVDLTHQTLWVVDADGERVFGPTVVRTGMAGYATQTGKLPIANRAEREWSVPYKVWLPYWQHFYMGQGLHETTTYLHDSFGSHGCVNLLHDDAVKLYELLDVGTVLHIFGHRPGT